MSHAASWRSEPYHLAARVRTLAETALGPVCLTEIDRHGRLLPHAHPVATLYVCLAGQAEIVLEGKPRPVGPDEHWIVPANGLHALSNPGPAPLRLLLVPVEPPVRPARSLLARWRRWLPGR